MSLLNSRISVVIPTYNSSVHIAETIAAIVDQVEVPAELLIVDDNSTDDTRELARRLNVPFPLRILERKTNSGGPAIPMNEGIAAAAGEYVALCDHDDLFLPEKLASQKRVLDEHPEIDLVVSDYESVSDEGIVPYSSAGDRNPTMHALVCGAGEVNVVPAAVFRRAVAEAPGLVSGCTGMMFRRSLWNESGRFRAEDGPASDFGFLLRASRGPVAWINRVLFQRRMHPNNLSRRGPTTELNGHRLVMEWLTNEPALDSSDAHSIREKWSQRLHRVARSARRRRDWQAYRAVQCHLQQFGTDSITSPILRERIYPRWMYWLKDRLLGKRKKGSLA